MMTIQWTLRPFAELTVNELYAILQLRSEVFVVEQQCVYLDTDNKDQSSHHLMGWQDDKLVAYTRLLPSGLAFREPSIGRVVSSPSVRGTGIGRQLMERSIEVAHQLFGKVPIRIGAQCYLRTFYTSLGFREDSAVYLEDGIEHIEMVRSV